MDASALFALLEQEKGADCVLGYLDRAIMSVVNYTETLTLLMRDGHSVEEADHIIKSVLIDIVEFDQTQSKLDEYLSERDKYTYASAYLVFVSKFINSYTLLNNYNKVYLDTIINNQDALVKNAKIILPDS